MRVRGLGFMGFRVSGCLGFWCLGCSGTGLPQTKTRLMLMCVVSIVVVASCKAKSNVG